MLEVIAIVAILLAGGGMATSIDTDNQGNNAQTTIQQQEDNINE